MYCTEVKSDEQVAFFFSNKQEAQVERFESGEGVDFLELGKKLGM